MGNSSGDSLAPVAFSLRKKQSTMRSPRLKRRPDRRLYSGNMPVTPTSGSDFSRCPAFKWQLLHDILLGAKFGTSVGVFVKILNPQRISFESCEPSNCLSLSGSLGSSQAVTMVVAAGISGPRSGIPDAVRSTRVREQLAAQARSTKAAIEVRRGTVMGRSARCALPFRR